VLEQLAARSRERVVQYTWERTARETIRAYESVLEAHPRRAATRRRRRVALVTPWPPDRSGIANYNLRVAEKLGRHVDVEIVVGRPASEYHVPQEQGVTLIGAKEFAAARSVLRPDRVLYCMGNSAFHGYVYDLLRRYPGAVLFHDVRLTGFYGWFSGTELPEDPVGRFGGWFDSFYRGRMPDEIKESVPSWETQLELGIHMTLDVQRYAEQCFVHSEFGRTVLELDRGPAGPPTPIKVLPFGMPEWAAYEPDAARPLVISLGYVSEVKGLATLIDGFALLSAARPEARLVIAGPAEPHELERWRSYARERAPGAEIEIPGEVSAERYHELLFEASLAVQLRSTTNGEASAAVGDCLAAGIPTVVTDLGWLGDLPDAAVAKLALGSGPEVLARRIAEILDDSTRAAALSAAARATAAEASFERVAEAYLEALEL
jgi:glycosyltransferase involved in cell wall biosynthesis